MLVKVLSSDVSLLCSLIDDGGLSRMLSGCFEGVSARILVRNTSIYGDILNRFVSVDADCLSYEMNSCAKNIFLLSLLILLLRLSECNSSEAEQLCLGDIPVFFCDTNSCCLRDVSGNFLVNDCFSASALNSILKHLPRLSSDFDDQCKLLDKYLRVSLAPQGWRSNVNFSSIQDLSFPCVV